MAAHRGGRGRGAGGLGFTNPNPLRGSLEGGLASRIQLPLRKDPRALRPLADGPTGRSPDGDEAQPVPGRSDPEPGISIYQLKFQFMMRNFRDTN